jgi:hypothetical protein
MAGIEDCIQNSIEDSIQSEFSHLSACLCTFVRWAVELQTRRDHLRAAVVEVPSCILSSPEELPNGRIEQLVAWKKKKISQKLLEPL